MTYSRHKCVRTSGYVLAQSGLWFLLIALLIISSTFPLLASSKQPVVPGQTTYQNVSFLPCTSGFDPLLNRLFVLVQDHCGEDTPAVFGWVDPSTGLLTPLATIDEGDPIPPQAALIIDDTGSRAFIPAQGLVVDLQNGIVSNSPVPSFLFGINFDTQTEQFLGTNDFVSPMQVYSLSESSGGQTDLGGLSNTAVDSLDVIDQIHHTYLTEGYDSTQGQAFILQIDENNKGKPQRFYLPVHAHSTGRAYGLAFDSVHGSLYGLIDGYNDINDDGYLVKIDLSSGEINPIADIGPPLFGSATISVDQDNSLFGFILPNGSIPPAIATVDISPNRSWYVAARGEEASDAIDSWMYEAGYALGLRASQEPAGSVNNAILDFGAPQVQNIRGQTVYGASGYHHFFPVTPIKQSKRCLQSGQNCYLDIYTAAGFYIQGLWDGLQGHSEIKVRVVLGTSNDTLEKDRCPTGGAGGVTAAHGQAWSSMVQAISAFVALQGYQSQILVYGGIDAELGFSSPDKVEAWESGFNNPADLIDYGDAGGAPKECPGSWTSSDIIQVAGSNVIPEIYSDGAAHEWAKLARHSSMMIIAPLTEAKACAQTKDCDRRVKATPYQAWTKLTQYSHLPLSPATDIEWRLP